ncbi:Cerato-platanin-domain-containing protein [Crassisporium funariophilum]|nr:Cerato-platanin-domain-containing protein [Crassisporium funariophilum]
MKLLSSGRAPPKASGWLLTCRPWGRSPSCVGIIVDVKALTLISSGIKSTATLLKSLASFKQNLRYLSNTIMKLSGLLAPFALFVTSARGLSVSYDTAYDNASQSLNTVACSNGPNGLITRGYTTFGSLPKFPYIGGVPSIAGWNSPSCGSCWKLTYTNAQGVLKTVNILGIDVATPNYNIGLTAMNELTNGEAISLGRVDITAVKVAPYVCGL